MQLQAELAVSALQAKIGTRHTVLIDAITDDQDLARSKSDALQKLMAWCICLRI